MEKTKDPPSLRPVDEYLKAIGEAPQRDISPSTAAVGSTVEAEGPGHTPSYDELDWQQKMGQGVAKNLASVATSIPRAINAGIGLVAPETSEKLGTMAERIPGVKRMEAFAQEPSEGGWETAGNIGATTAETLMGRGGLGLGTKLAGQFPKAVWGGGGWVPVARPWLRNIGTGIENVASGMAAGAVTDPNDPGAGAALGGATAGATPLIGKALQSKTGQWFGGMVARHGPWVAVDMLAGHLGIPSSMLWNAGIAQYLIWHSSPGGRWLGKQGARGASWLGRFAERAKPLAVGSRAGGAENYLEQQGLPSYGGGTPDEAPPEPDE